MTTIRRISNSEIQSFKRCRRQWWLSWVRGLQLKKVNPLGALAIGSRLHVALASYYVPDGVQRADPRETLELLLKEASGQLREYAYAAGQIGVHPEQLKQFMDEASLQRIMLDGYMQWLEETGADQHYEIIEPESYHEAELDAALSQWWDMTILIIGRLDVKIRHRVTGMLLLLDHKTTGSIDQSIKSLRMNPQMRMYRLLLQLATGEEVSSAVYSMLRKVKRSIRATPPFFHREELRFNSHELAAFKQQLYGTINDMMETEAEVTDSPALHHSLVPPTPGTQCQMCVFRQECPMFDDGSRVEDALSNRFIVGEPLHYYGRDDLQSDNTATDGRGPVAPHPRRIEAG